MIRAKVIEASTVPGGKTIWSIETKHHRFIHGELLTHRVFSRNAMSSRAVPVKKILSQVWNDPAMPVHWGANQPGMQAKAQLTGWRLKVAKGLWKAASKVACGFAWGFIKVGLAKQVANRILEPWQWMTTIITATEWDNFFELRDHEDAQPEFRVLAQAIREAMQQYTPRTSVVHAPYTSVIERDSIDLLTLFKVSAARCARVSYLTHDGKTPSMEADLALFERLVGSKPLHASPIEHQAVAMAVDGRSNNFIGWKQFRQMWETTGSACVSQ